MRIQEPLAVALVLSVASLGAAAAEWQSYSNARFGVTADRPAGWKEMPPPANDDGRQFVSPDGKARITISGIFVVMNPAEETALRLEPNGGETVTYKHSTGSVIVLSGHTGNDIFYRKSILTCNGHIWNEISIVYPAADKDAYAGVVTHVANSLHGSRNGIASADDCKAT